MLRKKTPDPFSFFKAKIQINVNIVNTKKKN